MKRSLRLAAALLLGAASALPSTASARGSVQVGIGLGFPVYAPWPGYGAVTIGGAWHGHRHGGYGPWGHAWGPAWGPVWGPPVYVYGPMPPPVMAVPPPPEAPPPPPKPEPVVYPRNGQTAAQMESDRRACDRWAMTQPAAMADASVFQRAVEACMDGRGYTLR
jgi:hypothetical protein